MTTDSEIRSILTQTRTIAMVGVSSNTARPSHRVGTFLTARGVRVIGINPGLAGQTLFGETVVARLGDITDSVDMVDIFRASDAVPAIVAQALDLTGPRVIWMQLGVISAAGAAAAAAAGLAVVQDRCPKIEIERLGL